MLFNTTSFAIFFAIFFTVWVVLRPWHRLQNVWLVLGSYVFYGFWNVRFLGLLWFSTLVDYGVGRALGSTTDPKRRRRWITLSIVTQLSILGFFKYFGFFVDSGRQALLLLGVDVPARTLQIVLPVGVSFYTFQTMSYTIDVYRRVIPAERSLLSFATFASMFPQLVAGPIERARDMLPQVDRPRELTLARIYEGSWLVLWGLYKKVFIADNAATIVNAAFGKTAGLGQAEAVIALYAFALQIYGDFSGYTDVARGTAKILGFDFRLNFARPYLATDPSDFWRRWHISLSSWLRDYLYVPLGGNRGGTWKTYRNLMLTMLLGGLWHGASWTFVLWGAYHGALLVLHRLVSPILDRVRPAGGAGAVVYRWLAVLFMFHLVVLGWLPFRATSMAAVRDVLRAVFLGPSSAAPVSLSVYRLVSLAGLLVAYELWEERRPDPVPRLPAPARGLLYAVVLCALVIAGAPGGQAFIYFQF